MSACNETTTMVLEQLPDEFTYNELKERIALAYDECLICDILEISPEELLDAFEHKLIGKREEFEEDDEY